MSGRLRISRAGVAGAVLSLATVALPFGALEHAGAVGSVRTTACPSSIHALVNGGFEDFSDPDLGGVANNIPTYSGYGWWHGYDVANPGPDQILFLDLTVPTNYLTGWQTTAADHMVEIQRQVPTYTSSVDPVGTPYGPYSPARSGAASATTSSQPGYFDLYGPQAAEGTHWAELMANSPSALFQDIAVTSGERLFWSLKHRGRTNDNEEMRVMIGPAGGSLAQQTSIDKYAPTNADKFSGTPTYGSTPVSTSTIATDLDEGWTR